MEKIENKTKNSTKGERENFARASISHQCEIFAPGCEIFAPRCEIFAPRCEIFAQGCEKIRSPHLLFFFYSSSAPDFKSIKLVLDRTRRAWIDSTNLALKAYKNYKISHKMRSVE